MTRKTVNVVFYRTANGREPVCLNGSRKMTQHKHIGSSLDDLLESDGTLEQAEAEALKRVIVWQVQQAMKQTGVNKTQLAQRMRTSRTVVNRLLDEKDTGVTITTLVKAGCALGMTWTMESDGGNGSDQAA